MRIGVNCFLLQPHIGGMKTYFALLFDYLLEHDKSNQYVFFHFPQNASELAKLNSDRWREHAIEPPSQEEIVRYWDRIDVYFCPFGALYPRPAPLPSVVTVHDIQEVYFPEFFDVRALYERESHFPSSTRAADRVIAVSEYTKQTIVDNHGVDPRRIKVSHLAPEQVYLQDAELEAVPVPFERFVFFPANRWRHKNHDLLLRALRRLEERHGLEVNAVFTGYDVDEGYPLLAKAREYGVDSRVHSVGYVSKEQIASLYRRAEMLVFPSLFEGFGLPVLEAMAVGCPCALSRVTSLPEVGGEDAVYFDPNSVDEAADAIASLWQDADLRRDLTERGRLRAQRFSQQALAKVHLEAFGEAARDFSRLRYWWHLYIHQPRHHRRTERKFAPLLGSPSSMCEIAGLRVQFGDGWHNLEGGEEDWLRWTSGVGNILLETAAGGLEVELEGEWLSIARPNSLSVELDGKRIAQVELVADAAGFQALPPIRLALRKGINTLRLRSGNKGVRSEADPRPLAVAVHNLVVRAR